MHLQEIYGQAEFSKHDAPSIALNRQGHYYTHNLLLTLQSKIIGTNPYRTAIGQTMRTLNHLKLDSS
ncbi:hypothetical protein [Helicobacter sp.]|uniref:hypothetical protein n=1 Tax=Helicobacter sp. TaxID=218 RepID=UPI0025BCD29E|nr:hypothetical protein [Helicobacter sp.]MBR2494472.1 hypothetical protein [Helicobacter sp.]